LEEGKPKSQNDEEKWNLNLAWVTFTAGLLVTLGEMMCVQLGWWIGFV